MFNNSELTHLANSSYSGRMSKLPPRSPLPSINHMLTDRGSSLPKRPTPVPKDNQRHHQRTASERFIIEEQPAWLDDLLNESETPAGRGSHRRASSDSVVYLDFPRTYGEIQKNAEHELYSGDIASYRLPVPLDFSLQRNAPHSSFYLESDFIRRPIQDWNSSMNSCCYHASSMGDKSMLANIGPSCIHRDQKPLTAERPQTEKSGESDRRECSNRRVNSVDKSMFSNADRHDQKGCLNGKTTSSDTDPKSIKPHFAQHSRVRKLQYISELKRNVSILNAEGSDAATELAFLKRQHLILSLENKALMQRITTIALEKHIKDAEYVLLRKEVERLRDVYYNQQQERSKYQCGNAILDAATDHLDLHYFSLGSATQMETGPVKEPGCMNKAPYRCMMMLQKS